MRLRPADRPVLCAYKGVIVLGRARYEGMFRSHFTEHDELKVQKKNVYNIIGKTRLNRNSIRYGHEAYKY